MSDFPKYIFASQHHIEPGAKVGGDLRLTLDLQKMISDRLGYPPTPPLSIYHGFEFEDPSVIVVTINHVPHFGWSSPEDRERWVGISIRNDMGLGDLIVDRAHVVLEPDFSPLPGYARRKLNPEAKLFPIHTLPSRCSPETIKAAAEEYCRVNSSNELKHPLTAVVIGNLQPHIGLTMCREEDSSRIDDACALVAKRTIHQIQKFVKARGGGVLLATSRRTSMEDEYALTQALQPWLVDSETKLNPKDKNPYEAFLGLADEILVYGDSISMISDAVATRKPFRIIPDWNSQLTLKENSQDSNVVSFLKEKYQATVRYVADQYAEYFRIPLIVDAASQMDIPQTRRPIAYAGEESTYMAEYIVRNILLNGGKDLKSDMRISNPPSDFSGLDTAVDGICKLIRKKAADIGLG